jgi:hypothetical protein
MYSLDLEAPSKSGCLYFLMRVDKILNDICEMTLKLVTTVMYINTPIKFHSICSSNISCTRFYFQ